VKYALGHRAMGYYEIIVASHIDKKRARDFSGLDFTYLEGGRTLLYGTLPDQAAMFSVISKIRDMNLTLISVKRNDKEIETKP
jgi:hypothetical protein